MQAGGLDLEKTLGSGARGPAGRLDDHAHGVDLIEQTQAPALFLGVLIFGIEKDTAAAQYTVQIGDHGRTPAHIVALAERARLACEASVDEAPGRRIPARLPGRIDGELGRLLRNFHLVPNHDELSTRLIETEDCNRLSRRQDQHRGRAVKRISGSNLLFPRLQYICGRDPGTLAQIEHGKNGAHSAVDFEIGRPVKRIENQSMVSIAGPGHQFYVVQFLRYHGSQHAARLTPTQENVVSDNVELLLHFPLHIDCLRRPGVPCARCYTQRDRYLDSAVGDHFENGPDGSIEPAFHDPGLKGFARHVRSPKKWGCRPCLCRGAPGVQTNQSPNCGGRSTLPSPCPVARCPPPAAV